jgi:uncharacterized protein YkwD
MQHRLFIGRGPSNGIIKMRIQHFKVKALGLLFALMLVGFVLAQSQRAAFLNTDEGGVELRRIDTDMWVGVDVESVVGVGDVIRTDAEGTATIQFFGNASVTLLPNTTLQIDRLTEVDDEFFVEYTIITGRTQQLLVVNDEISALFEVNSPRMTVMTRGGQFDMLLGEGDTTEVLAHAGQVFVAGSTGLVEVPPGNGIRTDESSVLSEIVPATSIESLEVALDGAPTNFAIDADVMLNVRQGPALDNEILGMLNPEDIDRVQGVSEDGMWYRVPYDEGSGWVSSQSLDVTIENESLLAVFPQTQVEVESRERVVSIGADGTVTSADAGFNTPSLLSLYTVEELEVVARINEFRINQGLQPLKLNPVLSQLALDQASYLDSMPEDAWPQGEAVHNDRQGRNPRQRALGPGYAWPSYGRDDRVAVGEILYTGIDPEAAMEFWITSSIHNSTITNSGYREIGVGSLPHRFGTIYVVSFGSRPDVLPILIDPDADRLFVPTENYEFAEGDLGDWITDVQELQVLPAALGQSQEEVLGQLDENGWINWERTIDLPDGDFFTVVLRQGETTVVDTINRVEDTVLVRETIPQPGDEEPEEINVIPVFDVPPPIDFEPVGPSGIAATPIPPAPPAFVVPTNTPAAP